MPDLDIPTTPSAILPQQPTAIRIVCGFGGLFLLTLGCATAYFAPLGRGFFSVEWGYAFTAVGLSLLLFHAIRDGDTEVRRVYGLLGAIGLLVGIGLSLTPIKLTGMDVPKVGALLLPWGALSAMLGLLFLVNFARHETTGKYAAWVRLTLGGAGATFTLVGLGLGLIQPANMVGAGSVLTLLGLAYLIAGFCTTDTSTGWPALLAVGVGVVGLIVATIALGNSIFPTVLYSGPSGLKGANKKPEAWLILGRVVAIGVSLLPLYALRVKHWPKWLRWTLAGTGATFALLFLIGSFTSIGLVAPANYFVPGGLLLMLLGLLLSGTGWLAVSDHPFAVLTRREVAGLVYTPIAYIVVFASTLVAGLSQWMFFGGLQDNAVIAEPLLANHPGFEILAAIVSLFAVPAITMRSFSEERKSGTLEVLFTAPVDEWPVVLSKFLPALGLYLMLFVPPSLCMLAMVAIGGVSFDYQPLLTYYLTVLLCGCSFVAIGLFVSSFTRDQIIAALLTFSVMLFLFLVSFFGPKLSQNITSLPPATTAALSAVLDRLGYLGSWMVALKGQLELNRVVFQLSLAVFFLFATTKVLEARKWS